MDYPCKNCLVKMICTTRCEKVENLMFEIPNIITCEFCGSKLQDYYICNGCNIHNTVVIGFKNDISM
jgi:hypothetical protein